MTEDERNVVITGFMGTGKSVVARGVAQKLGRSYVDMDEIIVQRAGMSIPEIFRQSGEAAFRQMERALCEELSRSANLVIATGGGTLVDAHNRALLGRNGCLICLDCETGDLLQRLRGDTSRPMLWAEDPEQRLHELLRARRPAYAEIPHHIDTTARPIEEVIAEVVSLLRARPQVWYTATPTGSYQIQLVEGGLARLGVLLEVRDVSANVVIVTDENVWPLYGDRVCDSLRRSHFNPSAVVLPAGESHKTLDSVRELYDRFADAELDRSGAVIALGGGVITDMAGFAAATFMRGVSLVQVPTTLLSMVDASIGGKVAVDHPRGKNLIGAFVRPLLVMLDPQTLPTLPAVELRAGLAEIIKAGIIADPALFEMFERSTVPVDLREAIERAIAVKLAIVEQDPYETGRRAVLNLGHTFAHAFEVLAEYRLHHGLAVSMGIAAAAYLAELRGLCATQTAERIIHTLRKHDLPVQYDAHPPDAVCQAMRTDKKRRGNKLRFILPRAIGDVIVDADVPENQVIAALERMHP